MYILIYYTLKTHLYTIFLPLTLSSLSLFSFMWEAAMGTQPCHINMRTGETLPLLPPRCSCRGLQQLKRQLLSPDMAGHVSQQLVKGGQRASTPTEAGHNRAGLVAATCRGDSPLTQTTPASATLKAPWIAPRQGSLGARVAMVAAEFGSNKREGNRRWTGEGDFGVARKGTERRGDF